MRGTLTCSAVANSFDRYNHDRDSTIVLARLLVFFRFWLMLLPTSIHYGFIFSCVLVRIYAYVLMSLAYIMTVAKMLARGRPVSSQGFIPRAWPCLALRLIPFPDSS